MKKKYPAPSADIQFKKYWKKFLPKVMERDNFHESHLEQLNILCNLYSEYHKLNEFILTNGYSYESDGRYGESRREYPEVKIFQKVTAEIRHYSKILGLILNKDSATKEREDADEWS